MERMQQYYMSDTKQDVYCNLQCQCRYLDYSLDSVMHQQMEVKGTAHYHNITKRERGKLREEGGGEKGGDRNALLNCNAFYIMMGKCVGAYGLLAPLRQSFKNFILCGESKPDLSKKWTLVGE